MALVSTVIDGKEVRVERDSWALTVARKMGIDIPTLCYHPALEPYGACRLCVVEVTKGKWTWLTTSCDLPIREGLEIRTDTPAVKKARRMALELLWAQAPEAEAIEKLAEKMGLEKPRFASRNETGKCILCGLCVRVCTQVLGESAISFTHRGARRMVETPFNKESSACIGCGACVEICPTGHIRALYEKASLNLETWHTDLPLAECPRCGRPLATERLVQWVESRAPFSGSEARLCPACRSSETANKWMQAVRLAASAK